MRRLVAMAALLGWTLLGGCSDTGSPVSGDDGVDDPDPISFAAEIQPIFTASCIGCHGGEAPVAGLNLEASVSHDAIFEVESSGYPPGLRVAAGDPEQSVLYQKLMGNLDFGGLMPPDAALPDDQLVKIELWINEGALNN